MAAKKAKKVKKSVKRTAKKTAKKTGKSSVKRASSTVDTVVDNEIIRSEFEIDRASLNVANRTVDVSFSSETTDVRSFGTPQILVHEPEAMNLSALKLGAVLFHHDPTNIVGRIANARLDPDTRRGLATIVFDDDDQGNHALRKVQSGSLRGVSVGAKVQQWSRLDPGDEWQSPEGRAFRGPADLAVKWSPVEISLTPTPADSEVGVGRAVTVEVEEMPKKLKDFLVARGLREGATEKEANEFMESLELVSRSEVDTMLAEERSKAVETEPETSSEPALTKSDVERAVQDERKRVADIRDLCRMYPETAALESELVRDGKVTVDVARARCWDEMAKARPAMPSGVHAIEYGEDARDKFSRAAEQHLLMRTNNINERDNAEECKLAREVEAFSLFDLARESLKRSSVDSKGISRDNLIHRAISNTTSTFPSILENVANKSMLRGWEEAASTWEAVAASKSVSDFKSVSRLKLGDSGDLTLQPEGAPMSEQTVPEVKESYSVATYSRRFGLSRQAIINDDLDALSDIPSKMGAAARRLPNQLFYDELALNSGSGPVMVEGSGSLNLFAVHGSGTNAVADALTIDKLGEARSALRRVTGLVATGETAPTLNLTADVLLVPPNQESKALQFMQQLTPAVVTNAQPSWIGQLTLVVEPRLHDIDADAWYLVSRQVDGGEVAFLNGQRQPTQIRVEGTNVLGVEWGLFLDCGVKFVEHRGWYRSNP